MNRQAVDKPEAGRDASRVTQGINSADVGQPKERAAMPKNEPQETTLYSVREFLRADTLDSFRAYFEEVRWLQESEDAEPPVYVNAGFYLAEDGVGHFCFDHAHEIEDLDELLHVSTKIVRGLTGLNEAIRKYLLEREAEASARAAKVPE